MSSAARRIRNSASATSLVNVYDAYTIDEHLTCFDFYEILIERSALIFASIVFACVTVTQEGVTTLGTAINAHLISPRRAARVVAILQIRRLLFVCSDIPPHRRAARTARSCYRIERWQLPC
jgi:membrane-associated phospholipid phosphatase